MRRSAPCNVAHARRNIQRGHGGHGIRLSQHRDNRIETQKSAKIDSGSPNDQNRNRNRQREREYLTLCAARRIASWASFAASPYAASAPVWRGVLLRNIEREAAALADVLSMPGGYADESGVCA